MLFRTQCNTCTNRRRLSVILHHKCFTRCCSLWQMSNDGYCIVSWHRTLRPTPEMPRNYVCGFRCDLCWLVLHSFYKHVSLTNQLMAVQLRHQCLGTTGWCHKCWTISPVQANQPARSASKTCIRLYTTQTCCHIAVLSEHIWMSCYSLIWYQVAVMTVAANHHKDLDQLYSFNCFVTEHVSTGGNAVASVLPSTRPYVSTVTFEPSDLWPWPFHVCGSCPQLSWYWRKWKILQVTVTGEKLWSHSWRRRRSLWYK